MKRKKEIVVRYKDCRYQVGYWQGKSGSPDNDFWCFGIKNTKEEANRLLRTVIEKQPYLYRGCEL